MKKGALQISFTWLFAIIVGIIILFLAIFASTRLLKTEQYTIDTTTAKRIGILTNPLETGFESAEKNIMSLPSETRIYNSCSNIGSFGEQAIKLSQKSFGKWSELGGDVFFENKYFFSEEMIQGKDFYLFSKPFRFPFKVADVIIMIPKDKEYCFEDAPEDIKNELSNLKLDNIKFDECEDFETKDKVCFNWGDCGAVVDYSGKRVEKDDDIIYFTDNSLMYAGIFSNALVYECQVKRLMKRASELALLYHDKSVFIAQRNCNSNIGGELLALSDASGALESSRNLNGLVSIADSIESKNSVANCRLW